MDSQLALLLAAIAGLISIAVGLWSFGVFSRMRFGTRSKLFAAFLVVGVALAGALALHQARLERHHYWDMKVEDTCNYVQRLDIENGVTKGHPKCYYDSITWHRKAGWQDPVALVVLFAGVGGGAVLGASALRWPRDTLGNTP
jgi:hypothetical protein